MPILKIKNCGMGVNRDLMPEELASGTWTNVQNMRARDGFAEKFKGMQAAFTTPVETPYFLTTYITNAARFVVWAGLTKVYADDGTTAEDITGTPPTGGIDDRWSGGALNGVLVMNNGVDDPAYWGGVTATDLIILPGWTTGWKSDVIRPFGNYLVALGNTRGGDKLPHNVEWSNAAAPGTLPTDWTSTATNDAGNVDLAETPGQMVDCLPLGNANIIFTQDSMYSMTYIGGNQVFQFNRLPGNDGLLARGCVVQTPKGQVFLSNGDVMIHQGQGAQSIAEGRVRQWLFDTMDTDNAQRSFLCLNPQKTEVWIVFPSNGQETCDMVLAWNWADDTWGIRDVLMATYGNSGLVSAAIALDTWADHPEAWIDNGATWAENEYSENESRLLLCHAIPTISLAETGTNDFGDPLDWMLEETGITFDDPDSVKTLKSIRPRFNAPTGTQILVYFGAAMVPTAAPMYADPVTYTVGTDDKAFSFASGRFLAVKYEGVGPQDVQIRSEDLEFELAGKY